MEFSAVDFLAGLFGGDSPPVVEAVEPNTASGGNSVHDATAAPERNSVHNPDEATPAVGQFAHWVRRQDVAGRWGWEAPGLPEWQRRWARF